MTQQQALEVKDLAKPVVRALGVITERECPSLDCDDGWVGIYITDKKCPKCNGTGKVGWKWVLEVKQTVLYRKELMFIVSVEETRLSLLPFDIPYLGESLDDYVCNPEIIDVVPILEWEEIERVLEGVGYHIWIDLPKYGYDPVIPIHYCLLVGKDEYGEETARIKTEDKFRTRAVYKAVIALGKKLGEELK